MAVLQDIKVADETFLATALLHREHPHREDFTIAEIVDRATQENIHGELRPGVRVHATLHCVANRAPNPGTYRMLYATGKSTRRLLLEGDNIHADRNGKIFPDPDQVPGKYQELIAWAQRRFHKDRAPGRTRWLGGILDLFGAGKDLWKDEDPDEYVRKQREGWE